MQQITNNKVYESSIIESRSREMCSKQKLPQTRIDVDRIFYLHERSMSEINDSLVAHLKAI